MGIKVANINQMKHINSEGALQTAILLFFCLAGIAETTFSRTLIVAADSSEEFSRITDAASIARAGDTILVRDGRYDYERFTIIPDSVVVLAEHSGFASIYGNTDQYVIWLRRYATMSGFFITVHWPSIMQDLVVANEGCTIRNCAFLPDTRIGSQLTLSGENPQPIVRNCGFSLIGSTFAIVWGGVHDLWMPNNYWGMIDTAQIHGRIDDGSHGDTTRGRVFVTPVWDHFEWLSVHGERQSNALVDKLQIKEVCPNPFNARTTISLSVPRPSYISATVYDLLGRRMDVITLPVMHGGTYQFNWEASNHGTGIYFLEVSDGRQTVTTKLFLLK
jgi:hypothetical protein